jgi:hypothetical protein
MDRIVSWLGSRGAPWLVVIIGLALAAPALTASFTADDHLHRVISRSAPGIDGLHARPLDLFVFANGDAADTARLRDAGAYPWWVDPSLRLSFLRPISSATHAVDHALWPDSSTAQLAHNLAWLALALLVAWLFYRRFLPLRWIAILALALYAFDDARGPVVGWIANRNALVALALAIPALLVHDRWRRDDWAPGRWLAPLVFAVSLGAGESSIAIVAYLVAHALWLDRGTWKDRLVALAPYVVIIVAWRVIYAHLGYGVAGSGIYVDPGADPAGFLTAAGTRIPFLLTGQLSLPWSDAASLYPILGAVCTMLLVSLATLAIVGLACARLLRRDPVSRFFATGMVLAAVPIASTFPADRLLGFVGLGAMGLVAQLIAAALRHRDQLGDGRVRRAGGIIVAAAMVLVHLVLSPPLLVLRSRGMIAVGQVIDRADAGIPSDPGVADKTVIIVTTPSDALAGYIPIMRVSRGQARPAHLLWLATGTTEVTLDRIDATTLRVTAPDGLLRYQIDQMMRSPRVRPFAVGDEVALSTATLVVEAVTTDGRPSRVLARFAVPLEDPSLIWRRWEGTTYVPYRPLGVGDSETFLPIDLLQLLAD